MNRGTSYEQDSRFVDKTHKMLYESVWPDCYSTRYDLSKLNMKPIYSWIQERVENLLGHQDDVVSGTAISIFDQCIQTAQKPCAKQMHITLCGFLKEKTLTFMTQLWAELEKTQRLPQACDDHEVKGKWKKGDDIERESSKQPSKSKRDLDKKFVKSRSDRRSKSPKRDRSRQRHSERQKGRGKQRRKESTRDRRERRRSPHDGEKVRRKRKDKYPSSSSSVISSDE